MKAKQPQALPAGVKQADLSYPKRTLEPGQRYSPVKHLPLALVQFRDGRDEWVVRVLQIARGRTSERSYAVRVSDGGLCRVGNGPHVKREVTVYVHGGNAERLQKLVALEEAGAVQAGQVRDRISSRRAEGQLRRARGERYWHWSS